VAYREAVKLTAEQVHPKAMAEARRAVRQAAGQWARGAAIAVPEAAELAAVAWSEVLVEARKALEAARATVEAARAAFWEASLAVAEVDECEKQVRAKLKEEEEEVAALVKLEATAARRRRRDGD
jgi:hypothetical protein